MMRLPQFQYFAPKTVAEAAALLHEHGANAMVVAGGTDLYPNMKRQVQTPRVVIGLRGIPALRGVRGTARDGLAIGANTTLTAVVATAWRSAPTPRSPRWPRTRASPRATPR